MKRVVRKVKAARLKAGLTQTELARRLGRSVVLVCRVEGGHVDIGERYVRAVLAACGLPENWEP